MKRNITYPPDKSWWATRFSSLRVRLIAGFALIALLAVTLAGVLGLVMIRWLGEQYEQDYLDLYAEVLSAQVEPLLETPPADPEQLQALADQLARDGSLHVRILDSGSQVLADSGSPGSVFTFQTRDGAEQWQATRSPGEGQAQEIQREMPFEQVPSQSTPIYLVYSPARSERILTAPIGDPDAPLGYVELSQGPDFVERSLSSAREAFFRAGLLALAAALLVGWIAGSRLSAPLVELARAVEEIRADNRSRDRQGRSSSRAQVRSQDEVGRLAEQFNLMADELEDSLAALEAERDSLRRFISDASHELRTPVTSLQMYTELLLGPDGDEPHTRQEFLAENQSQIARLVWITNNLLDLSRLDTGIVQLAMAPCPVSGLLDSVIHEFQPRAAEKGVCLLVNKPQPDVVFQGDRQRLHIVLANLLDNALKFTPRGGRVELGGEDIPGGMRLWVQDSGPGIPAEDLPHVFERFYRGKDRAVPGSGLGLAIVKSIVELHGGTVGIDSAPGRGTRVEILL